MTTRNLGFAGSMGPNDAIVAAIAETSVPGPMHACRDPRRTGARDRVDRAALVSELARRPELGEAVQGSPDRMIDVRLGMGGADEVDVATEQDPAARHRGQEARDTLPVALRIGRQLEARDGVVAADPQRKVGLPAGGVHPFAEAAAEFAHPGDRVGLPKNA